MSPLHAAIDRAAQRYRRQSSFAGGFARGKLRHDPAYAALVDRGLVRASRVVDLGCGKGYLLALLVEAARERGQRPPELVGVEISRRAVAAAREALGESASIVEGDLVSAPVPRCDAAVLLDVLHYLDAATQHELLARVASALSPGGRLFVRDADNAGGSSFLAVRTSERIVATLRGLPWRRFHYRSSADWRSSLERLGLEVTVEPMRGKTPFANVLLEGRTS